MAKELERVVDNLETVFRGDAWHGPSVMEIMQSLPAEVVDKKNDVSKYTIAELVYHMYAWRVFIIEKLDDNIHFKLESHEDNWGSKEDVSSGNWSKLLEKLKKSQNDIVERLNTMDDSILEKRVAGEHYDFYTLLTGLIQHDTYHLGMIWVLWQ